MVWFRRAAASLLSLAIVAFFGSGILAMSGVTSLPAMPPGISLADAEALAGPFRQLMERQDEALQKSFVEGVDLSKSAATFEAMRNVVPAGTPKNQRLLQWTVFVESRGSTTLSGVHEAQYPSGAIRIETRLFRTDAGSDWKLADLHIRSATWEELAVVRPSFFEMPLLVYAVLALMGISFLLIWATAVACLLMDKIRLRWLWLLFILVGVGLLRVDLMGKWDFSLVYFQLCGVSYTWSGSAFETWILGVSVPLGAVLFWIFGRGRRGDVAELADNAGPPESL